MFSEDDYIPKLEEESDLIKSGDTATSDSDVENRQANIVEQQNSIQTWINNSSPKEKGSGEGQETKDNSTNSGDGKTGQESDALEKTEKNKDGSAEDS